MTVLASLLPPARAVFFDSNGNPLAGGLVYSFVPGGTTPKTTWQDAGETTANPNPIVLDASGSCLLYGAGNYQLTVEDGLGNSVPGYSGVTVDTLSPVLAISTAIAPAVATIAALRLATTSTLTQAQCSVLGYYAAADGGEGQFWYASTDTTSADNGGTIIVDTSARRWYRMTGGAPLNVRWFGAKGNATTDDTAAIQACITAAQGTNPRSVYAPVGQYVVSATLNITDALTIYGDNPGIGPGVTTDTNCTQFLCASTFTTGDVFSATTLYSCTFRDFQIAGATGLAFSSACPRTSGAGIHITGPTGHVNMCSVVDHVCFSGVAGGVQLTRCQENNLIRSCYFQAWANNSQAVYIDNGSTSVESGMGQITENHFFGNPASTQVSCIDAHCGYGAVRANKFLGAQYGLRVIADQSVNIGSVIVALNSFEELTAQSISVTQTGTVSIASVIISDNQFSNITNTGLQAHISVVGAPAADISDVDISGNNFYSHLTYATASFIAVTATNVSVSNNRGTITGGSAYGVIVNSGCVDISVLDNQWRAAGGALLGTTGYLIQATTVLRDLLSTAFTVAVLPIDAQNGSQLYATDGQSTSSTNLTVTGAGSGVMALRQRGAWFTPGAITG